MKKYKKCSIFFDTNAFEYRQNDVIILSEIRASSLFYEVLRTIELFGLSEKVSIFLPEIVWEEVKLHMVNKYKSAVDSLNSKIKEAQQVLGELVDVSCEFGEIKGVSEYKRYVEEIAQEFLNNPKNKASIIKYPNDANTIDTIVAKALNGMPPFTRVTSNRKEYSDAGFKDALIWETVSLSKDEELVIFITKDFDFNKVDSNGVNICATLIEVKNVLINNLDISTEGLFFKSLLDDNSDLVSLIMAENGFENFKSVKVDSIVEYWLDKDVEGEETSVLNVMCDIIVDNIAHKFTIRYDLNANELVDSCCEI